MAKKINLGKVGICPMGDYARSKSYERLSSVFYNHEYWVAVKDVPVGAVPSATSEYWQKMASRGEQGPQGQSYVDKELVPIVDNLTTGGSSNVLSAEQGKILKAELTELESETGLGGLNLIQNRTYWVGGYVNANDGKPALIYETNTNRKMIIIPVNEGDVLYYWFEGNRANLNAFLDETKERIAANFSVNEGLNEINVPLGASYVAFTIQFGETDSYKGKWLIKGDSNVGNIQEQILQLNGKLESEFIIKDSRSYYASNYTLLPITCAKGDVLRVSVEITNYQDTRVLVVYNGENSLRLLDTASQGTGFINGFMEVTCPEDIETLGVYVDMSQDYTLKVEKYGYVYNSIAKLNKATSVIPELESNLDSLSSDYYGYSEEKVVISGNWNKLFERLSLSKGEKFRMRINTQSAFSRLILGNVDNRIFDSYSKGIPSNDTWINLSSNYDLSSVDIFMVFSDGNDANVRVEIQKGVGALEGVIEDVKNEIVNSDILWGKRWAVCGDSFTDGATDTLVQEGKYIGKQYVYPYLIGNRCNMEVLDFFDSGKTLAYPASGGFENSLTAPSQPFYYQNIPEDVDYITIYLGINDSHHNYGSSGSDGEDITGHIPLGSIDDNTTASYYGAWNVVLSWLIENRPFAHIGIIVSNGCDSDSYRIAQIEIAKKYGIPYIDLNGDERTPAMIRSTNPNIAASVKESRLRTQSVSETNSHPNDAAHLFESTFIENFLRSL